MLAELTPSPATRFVALDVHRQYLMVGAVDIQQHVVISPRRFGFAAFAEWASAHLTHADAIVLEATSNAWLLYDQLQPLVAEVVVAHPQAVKLIAAARVKTDSRDTIKLASRLPANLIPAVWVPPQAVRELRALVTHRNRLGKPRTQAAHRLHSVLHRHNFDPPPGTPFAVHQREWWLTLDLPLAEKLRVQQDLSLYQTLETLMRGERSRTRSTFHLRPVGQTGSVSGAVAWAGGPLGYASAGRHWGNHPFSLSQALGGLCWRRRPVFTSREKPIAGGASPRRGAVIYVECWLRQPGWRSSIIRTGKPSLSAWPRALANKRRLSPLLGNCS